MRFLIVFLLLATCAGAVPVDPYAENGIAAIDGPYIMCTSGEVSWIRLGSGGGGQMYWTLQYTVPVPLDQIADWNFVFILTHAGDRWFWGGESYGWRLAPPVPCAEPIQSEKSSIGDVKSMFR